MTLCARDLGDHGCVSQLMVSQLMATKRGHGLASSYARSCGVPGPRAGRAASAGPVGLAVQEVREDAPGGRVVHVVTAELAASGCPSRGVLSISAKGQVTSRPRDTPDGTVSLRLVWPKRRRRCAWSARARGSFTEQVAAVPARDRLTRRLCEEPGHADAEQRRWVAEAAAHYGVG